MSVAIDTRKVARFGTLPTIEGYEVISEDTGRPVAHRPSLRSASGVAFVLNGAAAHGPRALSAAFANVRPEAAE